MDPGADTAAVHGALEVLARRGAFRSFDAAPARGSSMEFRMGWLRDREFRLTYEPRGRRLRVHGLFADAPRDPPMAANLRRYLKTLAAGDRPPHRRIDPARLELAARTSADDIDLHATFHDPDAGWATERLIATVNEIYLMFLSDPLYYEYRVRVMSAHADWG